MNLMSRNLVLGVVALLLAVPTFLQLRSEVETFVDVGRIPKMFDGFTSDNVSAILVALPKAQQPEMPVAAVANQQQSQPIAYEQLVMQLTDKGWRMAQNPGEPAGDLVGVPILRQRIEADVFSHLRMIRNDPDTLVQRNASLEQLVQYGLDEAHAFLIRVMSGQTIVAELFVGDDSGVGQTGTDGVRGVFVRQKGSSDVVLYEWAKPWRRSVEPSGWVDRTLMRVEPSSVRKLTLKNAASGGVTFVFEREPNKAKWRATAGNEGLGAVRQAEVEGLLQRLRYLSVQSFDRPLSRAGNMADLGLFPAQTQISFTIVEGGKSEEVRIAIGRRLPERNEYYITCSKVPLFVMTWSPSQVTPFELDVAKRLFDPAASGGK